MADEFEGNSWDNYYNHLPLTLSADVRKIYFRNNYKKSVSFFHSFIMVCSISFEGYQIPIISFFLEENAMLTCFFKCIYN